MVASSSPSRIIAAPRIHSPCSRMTGSADGSGRFIRSRSRLAGEPADVLISPRLAHLGLMDFHRAAEAMPEGVAAVKRVQPAIEYALAG